MMTGQVHYEIYHTCTTILQRELNVEPSKATREAYEQLLGVNTKASPTVPIKAGFSPMVGREWEWSQLLQAWRTW